MCQAPPRPIQKCRPIPPSVKLSAALLLAVVSSIVASFLAGRLVRLAVARSNPNVRDDDVRVVRLRNSVAACAQHLRVRIPLRGDASPAELLRALTTLYDGSDSPPRVDCVARSERSSSCFAVFPGGRSAAAATAIAHVFPHADDAFALAADAALPCDDDGGGAVVESFLRAVSSVVSDDDDDDDVPLQWSHRLRGLRDAPPPGPANRNRNPLDGEMATDVLRATDAKRLAAHRATPFQSVHVYSLPWRTRPDRGDASGDRALYLDGVLQSSLRGEAPYHEGLVHPALLSHENPRRVGIVGGGEGATLREVLKHVTVESVVMWEIDEALVELAREVLREWNDCSDILLDDRDDGDEEEEEKEKKKDRGYKSCFDDDRVQIHYVDAFRWFVDRYHDENATQHDESFDVILVDALDPDDFVEFADKLYADATFLRSLRNALSPRGILAVQLGAAPDAVDPPDESGPFRNRARILSELPRVGFRSMHMYEEGRCEFYHPWSILAAFVAYETRADWYRNAAEIQIELRRRIRGTKSGRPPLRHFDAGTMYGYQVPPKSMETAYCRSVVEEEGEEPEECDEYDGFWTEAVRVPASGVRVGKSGVSERAGRGVFAAEDIPPGAMIASEEGTKAFHVAPSTWRVLDSLYEWADESDGFHGIEEELSAMKYFIEGYGYACQLLGDTHHTIDSGAMTFSNHGCNGSYNYGYEFHPSTEGTINLASREIPREYDCTAKPYSPLQERHLRQILTSGDVALREIKAGEEILVNYLLYANPDEWTEEVRRLRDQCDGGAVGEISEYESGIREDR